LLLAMVVLGRRGELLAAAVAIAALVLALCSRKKRRIILIAGSVFAAAAVMLVLAFLPQLGKIPVLARYVETIEQILAGADISSGRGILMAMGWAGFVSRPLFGLGWGQYVQMSAQIGMCDTDGNLIEDCHNIYLQFLCETGIVGAVLLLVPIFYLFVTTCRMLRAAKTMEDPMPLRFVSVSFLLQVFLLTLGMYDPSFQKIVFWCFYALALMFANAALVRSGWRPTGPLTRALDRLSAALAPAGDRVWTCLRRFVH
jgi:O-antigen ligase